MIGDFLANKLNKIISKNMAKAKLQENTVDKTLTEIKLLLLEADVNETVIDYVIEQAATKTKKELALSKLKPSLLMLKILQQEITAVLGGNISELNLKNRPSMIMLVGLQGSGKTTTAAKIANLVHKKYSKKPLLVACDIYRPAAVEQLMTLGKQINIPVFRAKKKNPVAVAEAALKYAKKNKHDCLIIDTAGRLQIDSALIKELKNIRKAVSPQEIIHVVDGMAGQDIINVVNEFNSNIKLTGVAVTKLDGDSRGGATLSIRKITKLPIKFIGTGEGIANLQLFYPERMASRILGMGDIKTLFETAVDVINARTMKQTMGRMMRGQFDMQDMYNQLKQMKKIGSLSKISKMLPGIPRLDEAKIQQAETDLFNFETLISSMTIEERRNARYLKHLSRKARIIQGSGSDQKKYNNMINKYEKTKKQVDLIAKNIRAGRMPNFKNGTFF